MGIMEALVVAALGRSPYEEQLLGPQITTEDNKAVDMGQRYDERGHPVNLQTRQRMKDHVRASNEVMQAAGIIEETSDIQARDKLVEDHLRRETEVGLRRLEFGRVLLVAGVWGVVGLRRRILVYKRYSGSFLDIIYRERTHFSIPHLTTVGTPALAVYQCIEWTGLLLRAVVNGPNGETAFKGSRLKERGAMLSRVILDFGFGYLMLHYQMFAILQQLNLVSSERLFPSLRSLIPFSPFSPLQMPPKPTIYNPITLSLWSRSFISAVAPLALVLAHTAMSSIVSSLIYAPLFRLLPRPLNRQERLIVEVTKTLNELEDTIATAMMTDPTPRPNLMSQFEEPSGGDVTGPAQHTATLQALEGRQPLIDDSDDEEDQEMSQQALITFDVEATEISEAAVGTWSAELRSANEAPPKETVYQITALTMLPPLLAAEALSSVLAEIVLLPAEALMVRMVASSFRQSAGMGTRDMYALLDLPSGTWFSLLAVHTFEFAVVGVLWTAFTAASQFISGEHLLWRRADRKEEQ